RHISFILKIKSINTLFNGKDRKVVSNYRLKSLLAGFSKLLERLMHSRLIKYLFSNSIFILQQLHLKKACDLVKHEILLAKLYMNDIPDLAYYWFKFHLKNRFQKVIIQLT
ncbi:hypothetical protein J437_LFUL016955, partial [Ladona fulva]